MSGTFSKFRFDGSLEKNENSKQKLPDAQARQSLRNTDASFAAGARTDGRPTTTNTSSSTSSSAKPQQQDDSLRKLKGYKEVEGRVAPKHADEAASATSRGGRAGPKVIGNEDAAHRDEWGGGGGAEAGRKVRSKL
ncbi:hypothetical protein HDV00_001022 [Rhizophlyctis rosea]|nr:hypothetical protein HDV00_001022 [Rhizophlyctis rosea]